MTKYAKALLAAAPLCLLAATARAQGPIYLKGGISFNNVSNRGVLPGNLSGRTGFAAGVGFSTLKGPVGLGLEAMYAQRGVTGANDSNSRRLENIDVPAYLRVQIPTEAVSPYLFAGPQISFELSCKSGGGASCPSGRPDINYAGIIGAGIFFGNRGGFSLEGRYVYGLTDLKLNTVTSSSSYKTRSFMILGGISF